MEFMAFSKEQQLILYCSQARTNIADLDRIKALSALPMDWRYVLETALSNGVAPLLYYNLKKILPNHDTLSGTFEVLKEVYLTNTARNTYLINELCRILGEFTEKCIEVMILKGPALANLVYPDMGMRMYNDIDLLVMEEDLPAAEELMPKLGYVFSENALTPKQFRETHYHLAPYIHSDKKIILEIHWNVTNKFSLNIDSWWQRSRMMNIMGCSARVLSPNDLFLHICIHTSKHGFKNIAIRDLSDISEIIKCHGEEIDWVHFQKEIESYPIRREVYAIIYYVKRMFCSHESCLNWLTYQKTDFKLISLLEALLFCDDRDSVFPRNVSPIWFENSVRGKLKAVINNLVPNRELMAKRYSLPLFSKKIYFYYLIRPFMQIVKNRKYIGQFLILKAKEIFIKVSYALRRSA
jgi:hypothetical protein